MAAASTKVNGSGASSPGPGAFGFATSVPAAAVLNILEFGKFDSY